MFERAGEGVEGEGESGGGGDGNGGVKTELVTVGSQRVALPRRETSNRADRPADADDYGWDDCGWGPLEHYISSEASNANAFHEAVQKIINTSHPDRGLDYASEAVFSVGTDG